MVFGKLEMDVMKIAAMEAMVESKMDVARGRMQPSAQANFMQIMKVK